MDNQRIVDVAILDITPDPAQPRRVFDNDSIERLAASIREVGVLQPIRLRRVEGKLVIEDGERRWLSARVAGKETIPATISESAPDALTLQRQLICNCQREALNAIDRATSVERLIAETGWDAQTVAEKLGETSSSISKLRSLLTLPEAIRTSVRTGQIAASAAYDLARVTDPAKQAALAQELAEGRLTRDALSGRIKSERRQAAGNGTHLARGRIDLGGERAITVSGPKLSTERLIDWLEELLAKARKARAQGLEITTLIKMLNDQAKARTSAVS